MYNGYFGFSQWLFNKWKWLTWCFGLPCTQCVFSFHDTIWMSKFSVEWQIHPNVRFCSVWKQNKAIDVYSFVDKNFNSTFNPLGIDSYRRFNECEIRSHFDVQESGIRSFRSLLYAHKGNCVNSALVLID